MELFLPGMGRNHIFHSSTFVFRCRTVWKWECNRQSCALKNRRSGIMRVFVLRKRNVPSWLHGFLKEYLYWRTKTLLNKKSLEIQIKMFCFDNLGTGYWCIIETARVISFPLLKSEFIKFSTLVWNILAGFLLKKRSIGRVQSKSTGDKSGCGGLLTTQKGADIA